MNTATPWLSLIISLPTRNATARMRIWRALKGLGCAVLRDGVYLVPESAAREDALAELADATVKSGGNAHLLKLESRNSAQNDTFIALFDRGEDYAKLATDILEFRSSLPALEHATIPRMLNSLRKNFHTIAGIDFFPGEAKNQLAMALADAETHAAAFAIISANEPDAHPGTIQTREKSQYQGRKWATRKHLWIDRMASAWLIRNFIDADASFIWLERPQDCPADALGFDFDHAAFTHVGTRVTYEVLLASFKLDSNAALARIGALVHYLDVGGIPVAEASGLEMILKGARERCADDDALLDDASKIFNDLYAAYTNEEQRHEQ